MRRYQVPAKTAELDRDILPARLKQEIILTVGLSSPDWAVAKEGLLRVIEEIDQEQTEFETFDDYFDELDGHATTNVRLKAD